MTCSPPPHPFHFYLNSNTPHQHLFEVVECLFQLNAHPTILIPVPFKLMSEKNPAPPPLFPPHTYALSPLLAHLLNGIALMTNV